MKRIGLFACVVMFGAMAAAPAKADLLVIRWSTGWCQIVDSSWMPQPANQYRVIAKGIKTFDYANAALGAAIRSRKCG